MSNPIKSLLPTPLSMQFISDINALSKLPLPLYKFFISIFYAESDSALTSKSSPINIKDEQLLASILQREQIQHQLRSASINAIKLIENIALKVLKLMRTSEVEEVESNLENCQKYIGTVLSENTLIDEAKLTFLLEKLTSFTHDSLNSQPRSVETKFGIVEWSLYNLKKASMNLSTQKTSNSENHDQNGEQKSKNKNLRQINKMYVKVSFDENFSSSGIEKLIQSKFQSVHEGLTECKIEDVNNANKNNTDIKLRKSKPITMSLIDFRLFIEELEKVKNLNS